MGKNGQQMRIEPMLNALSRPQPSISSSLFLDIINSVTELISKQNADGSCLALLFNSHKRPFFQLKTTSYKKIIIVHVESESQQPPKRYVYLSIYLSIPTTPRSSLSKFSARQSFFLFYSTIINPRKKEKKSFN
jgi:hypothetical protein